MMRVRADGGQKNHLVTTLCIMIVFLALLFLHYGSFFGSKGQHNNTTLDHGSKFPRSLGWSHDDNGEVGKSEEPISEGGDESITPKSFPICDDRHSELNPCLDRHLIYQRRLKLHLNLMEHYERHCPQPERRYNCLIPPPPGYKVLCPDFVFPGSYKNGQEAGMKFGKTTYLTPILHMRNLIRTGRLMRVKRLNFQVEALISIYGADKYLASLANLQMLNFPNSNLNNEGRLRTFLDVGCGVASFGGYLLLFNIITVSLALNDVHQNRIQFALERGIPADRGVLGTKRLPYPPADLLKLLIVLVVGSIGFKGMGSFKSGNCFEMLLSDLLVESIVCKI